MRAFHVLTCFSLLLCRGLSENAASATGNDPVESIRQDLWKRYKQMQPQDHASTLKNIAQEQNEKNTFADDSKGSIESPETLSEHGPRTGTQSDHSDHRDSRDWTVDGQSWIASGHEEEKTDVATLRGRDIAEQKTDATIVRTPTKMGSRRQRDDKADAPRGPSTIQIVCAVLIWLGIAASAVATLAYCVYCPAGCSPIDAGRTLMFGSSTIDQAKHLQHMTEHCSMDGLPRKGHDDQVQANCLCGFLQLAAHKCVEAFLNCILHGPDTCQKSCPENWCTLFEEEGHQPRMVYDPEGATLLTRGFTSQGSSPVKPAAHELQLHETPLPNKATVRPPLGASPLTASPLAGPQAVFFPPPDNSPPPQEQARNIVSTAQESSPLPKQLMQGLPKATSVRPGDQAIAASVRVQANG